MLQDLGAPAGLQVSLTPVSPTAAAGIDWDLQECSKLSSCFPQRGTVDTYCDMRMSFLSDTSGRLLSDLSLARSDCIARLLGFEGNFAFVHLILRRRQRVPIGACIMIREAALD